MGKGLFRRLQRAPIFFLLIDPGQVIERRHVGRRQLEHALQLFLCLGQLAAGDLQIGQVDSDLDIVRVRLAPLLQPLLAFPGLARLRQRQVDLDQRRRGVIQRQSLFIFRQRLRGLFLHHQQVAFEHVANGRLAALLLYLLGQRDGLVDAVTARRQLSQRQLRLQEVRLQRQGLFQVIQRHRLVFQAHVHRGQAVVAGGRFGYQSDQLAVAFQRAGRVVIGQLGLAQHVQRVRIDRVGDEHLARQRQRLLLRPHAQVLTAQLQGRHHRVRILGGGLFQPRCHFLDLALAAGQVGQRRQRIDVLLILLHYRQQALLGQLRLFVLHRHLRQVARGREVVGLQCQRLFQRRRGLGRIALGQVDHPLQIEHGRIGLMVLDQLVDGRQRLVEMFHAQLGHGQQHAGTRGIAIELGRQFQLADGARIVALAQLAHRQRRMHIGLLGRQRGALLEQFGGLAVVAGLQIHIAGQRQQHRILLAVLQRRCQGGDRFGGLAALLQGHYQQLAGVHAGGNGFQVFAQMLFSLFQRSQVELDGARQ